MLRRFPLPGGRMAPPETYMDVRPPGFGGWALASLAREETWFGLRSTWRYFVVFVYHDEPAPPQSLMSGVLGAEDGLRVPREPLFVSSATRSISDEHALDEACRRLLEPRRVRSSVRAKWDGHPGPGAASDVSRSPLSYDENALLDMSLSLWRTWGGKPQTGLITHRCLTWLSSRFTPAAAEFVRLLARDRRAGLRRSRDELLEMQYAVCSGDREMFDSLTENNEDVAYRRLLRLSPPALDHIADFLEASVAGPDSLTAWTTALPAP